MKLELDAEVDRDGFSLRLATTIAGDACGVFGPSGAGKSTLLALVAGLVRPARGRIALDGEVLDDVAAGVHLPPHRRRLGVVFQHGHLLPHLTVEGNLRFGERLLRGDARRVAFSEVVDLLDVGGLLERRPSTLSGGERQRVALGRALLCSPRLLLMDEPLAALDGGRKRQILPYLRRIRDTFALPILHVSHDLSELLHVCDELLLLVGGRIAAQGPLTAIARDVRHLPLLHDAGLTNVLRGSILAHHAADGLSRILLHRGAEIACPLHRGDVGTECELLLRPEDVVIAAAPIPHISLQNQIPGTVAAIAIAEDRALVTIDIGPSLLAEVSLRSLAQLDLRPGRRICVLFKSSAVHFRQ